MLQHTAINPKEDEDTELPLSDEELSEIFHNMAVDAHADPELYQQVHSFLQPLDKNCRSGFCFLSCFATV